MEPLIRRRPRSAVALAFVLMAVTSTGAALAANINIVKITVAPATGKYGTAYNVVVKGTASRTGEELALSMVTSPAKACPSSYAGGFASLSGLASTNGKPIAPRYVHGKLALTIHAKLTISMPGTYGICAYLVVGSATIAHSSATITVTG